MGYSVLIVDDDKKTRNGLTQHIEWGKLECDTPLQASGGYEALEILKRHKIDIMITDIRMPEMSGLELSEIVTKTYCDTVIIILSGYSDFEYARKAMKFGIKHYIEKPTDLDHLSEVLSDIKNELITTKKNAEGLKEFKKKYNHVMELLVEQFFIDLTHGAIRSTENINNFMTEHNIDFNNSYFNIIAVRIPEFERIISKKWKYDSNQFVLSLRNTIRLAMNDFNHVYYIFSTDMDTLNIVLNYDNFNDVEPITSKLYANLNIFICEKSIITVSGSVTRVEHISLCFNQIREMRNSNKTGSTPGVFFYKPVSAVLHIDKTYPIEKEKLLLSYISDSNRLKALNIIDSIFSPLDESNEYFETYHEYYAKLYFAIESYLVFFNIDIKEITGERIFPLKKVMEFSNLNEMVSWLKVFVVKVIDYINDIKMPYSYKIVNKMKEYLESNYMGDITLFTASKVVYLSPAYIGKIFKKVTGHSFIERLTLIRINQAKTLLMDINTKIYEICSLIGYKSTKHFSQVFKDCTGMTPTEYRKSISLEKDVK